MLERNANRAGSHTVIQSSQDRKDETQVGRTSANSQAACQESVNTASSASQGVFSPLAHARLLVVFVSLQIVFIVVFDPQHLSFF